MASCKLEKERKKFQPPHLGKKIHQQVAEEKKIACRFARKKPLISRLARKQKTHHKFSAEAPPDH